jgi:fatty-acyl-CoA synthase
VYGHPRSYASGTSESPLLGETLSERFEKTVARWPDHEALVSCHQGVRWTWGQLKRRVDAFARGLVQAGLRPGDRLGMWSPNNSEWIVAQFAAARAGLLLVTLNPAYRASEIEYAINKVGCRGIITASGFRSVNYFSILRELMSLGAIPSLQIVIGIGPNEPGIIPFERVYCEAGVKQAALDDLSARIQPDDPACIMFTSGTTGQPKGAVLTHHGLNNNALAVGERMRLSERDRLCAPVPMFHVFGYSLSSLVCMTRGATLVFPSESFDVLTTLATIEQERCTALHGVPTMFISELNYPQFGGFDLTSLRTGIMAGAPCPIEVMRQCVERMHLRELIGGLGMTETTAASFATRWDDPVERRVETVGRIMPHVEAKVIDSEGRITPLGEPGELCIRGYGVMREYWNDPDRTREAIDADRWMHTGDLVVLDAEGYCSIKGRIKDIIIRGGENISPIEIEDFLYQHEGIAEVHVIGIPDDKYGEEVCAWIRLKSGFPLDAGAITEFCHNRIASYKIPKVVRFVDQFPTTASGKVQKFVMREAMRNYRKDAPPRS